MSFSWDCSLAFCVDDRLDDALAKLPALRHVEFAVRKGFDTKFAEEKFWASLKTSRSKISLVVL